MRKQDKNKWYVSKWRPTSNLFVTVDVGSKAITKRLENVSYNIILRNTNGSVNELTLHVYHLLSCHCLNVYL